MHVVLTQFPGIDWDFVYQVRPLSRSIDLVFDKIVSQWSFHCHIPSCSFFVTGQSHMLALADVICLTLLEVI